MADELGVTSGILLNFVKKQKLSYFGQTQNTRESNTRRKTERPAKQKKAKGTLGERSGRLDGGKCLEIGINSTRSVDAWKIHQCSNARKRISKREEELKAAMIRRGVRTESEGREGTRNLRL